MATTSPPYAGPHELVEVQHSVIDAPEAVFHSSIQGRLESVRCACGWTAQASEVNVTQALGEHITKYL